MKEITITLTREEAQRIATALNFHAVRLANQSATLGVDSIHPDFYHTEWSRVDQLWMKVYDAIYPETNKED